MEIREETEIKGIQIGKEVKFSLFADGMELYTDNTKDTIRKLLELISEFSKIVGYKINTLKSLAFLYTIYEKSEREIKESIPLTIATKRIKYLGINLPKETKEPYTENYKTLMKEIKDDMILDWKNQYYENYYQHLPKAIYRVNVTLIKLPMAFFTEREQNISQFIWKHRRLQITKAILRKKDGAGGINLPDFSSMYVNI